MNILEAARKYFGMANLDPSTVEQYTGPHMAGAFYAGAAFGALGARMTQEEILSAIRQAPASARAIEKLIGAADALAAARDNKGSDQLTAAWADFLAALSEAKCA